MADGLKRFTIDVPEDIHEAFQRQSFLGKPRRSMKDRIVEFMAREVGMAVPKLVDRRKLTRDEREKLERAEKGKPKK